MKILIINENRHNSIGGIETYTNHLITLLSNLGHEVSEFAFNLNPERIDILPLNPRAQALNRGIQTSQPLKLWHKRRIIRRGRQTIEALHHEYDLIINQSANIKWSKAIYRDRRWLYVQHFHPKFYQQHFIAGRVLAPLVRAIMHLLGIKHPFKHFQNCIFFTTEDAQLLQRGRKTKMQQSWIIPNGALNQMPTGCELKATSVNTQGQAKLVYIGRLDQRQKDLKRLIKLTTKWNLTIDFYGVGAQKWFHNRPHLYKGPLEPNAVAAVLRQYQFLILLSRYEGFPLIVSEALAVRNTHYHV